MPDPLAEAVRALRAGKLVIYPTDTLLGLGARADRPAAVQRLVEAKQRPHGMPISVAVSSTEEIEALGELSDAGRAFVRAHLPGPFTVLLRARPDAPLAPQLLAANGTVGVRVPDHPLARALARRAGPITSTSVNRHGDAPARTLAAARAAFGGSVDAYVAAVPTPSGRPSELIDLTGAQPRPIARSGTRGKR
jgi:L-threonylcarbamoyladenylate synthase